MAYQTLTAVANTSYRSYFISNGTQEYISMNTAQDGFADTVMVGVSSSSGERMMFDSAMDSTVDPDIEIVDTNGNYFWFVRNKKRKQS